MIALVWLGGLVWFVAEIPQRPTTDNTRTDAIVILTGGKHRMTYGLQLLAEDKAGKLFVSGVHETLSDKDLFNLVPTSIRGKIQSRRKDITLGHEAWNTIGNAEETARWIMQNECRSIRLVTSNYHMPRSLYEFRRRVKGITIIPDPVLPDDFDVVAWWRDSGDRALVLSEYHKYVAGVLGRLFVRATKDI
jgi:uncharacterized SAM-binding protein YcdF (DUF218 family)